MIKITGDEIWRNGEKIGWVNDHKIYAKDGKELGFFDDKHIRSADDHKLAYVDDDHLCSEDGHLKIPLEKVEESVQGMTTHALEKCAVYILLND